LSTATAREMGKIKMRNLSESQENLFSIYATKFDKSIFITKLALIDE
jgi:hypothetical protein